MATYTDVFQRKEIKYRITGEQRSRIEARLDEHMVPDEFVQSHILSLYFDTPERDLISRSLEKPLYKEKLRLRSYGEPTGEDRVFVELKKKYDGVVYKRRVSLSYDAACSWLAGDDYEQACKSHPLPDDAMADESLSEKTRQIAREIEAFRTMHGPLVPSMGISCQRKALANIEAEDEPPVRITFDSQIRYHDYFAELAEESEASSQSFTEDDTPGERDILMPSLINEDESIMEIKVTGSFPLWLTEILDECDALPGSFSKYGEAYRLCSGSEAETKPGPERDIRESAAA